MLALPVRAEMENLPEPNIGPSHQEGLAVKQAHPTKQKCRKPKSKRTRSDSSTVWELSMPDDCSGPTGAYEQQQGSAAEVSVISALQEFVQDSKSFRMPSRHSVLQWHFEEYSSNASEERSSGASSTQFRATVAFVLEGVPHHVVGDWRPSKNLAKRVAAESALTLFVGQWGGRLLQEDQGQEYQSATLVSKASAVDVLIQFCRFFPPCWETEPNFSTIWEESKDASCKGIVEINLFGVPHSFAGAECEDENAACSDVARRVLWYLQCPSFAEHFEVDITS